MENVEEKVNMILKRILKSDRPITPDKNIAEDLGFTSMDYMELIALVENEYDIIIPVNKITYIKTVSDLYYAVRNLENFLNESPGEYSGGNP